MESWSSLVPIDCHIGPSFAEFLTVSHDFLSLISILWTKTCWWFISVWSVWPKDHSNPQACSEDDMLNMLNIFTLYLSSGFYLRENGRMKDEWRTPTLLWYLFSTFGPPSTRIDLAFWRMFQNKHHTFQHLSRFWSPPSRNHILLKTCPPTSTTLHRLHVTASQGQLWFCDSSILYNHCCSVGYQVVTSIHCHSSFIIHKKLDYQIPCHQIWVEDLPKW